MARRHALPGLILMLMFAPGACVAPPPAPDSAADTALPLTSGRYQDDRVSLSTTFSMSLRGWERDGQWQDGLAIPPVDGSSTLIDGVAGRPEAVYKRPGLDEWYLPAPGGVELGWTVHDPTDEDLLFELDLHGVASVDQGEQGSEVIDEAGVSWHVSTVSAWDATGAALPVELDLNTQQMLVRVDAAGATAPITIDPVFSTIVTTRTGSISSAKFGTDVAMDGDVNGDGVEDLVVINGYSSGSTFYVYHGSASGLATSASTTIKMSTTYGAIILDHVAIAGDVNADGYDDVIVGSSAYRSAAGAAFLYFGSSAGLTSTDMIQFSGSRSGDGFGFALAGAGDVNGDGYDDVIIGAPNTSAGGTVYLFHGSATGPSTTASTTLTSGTSSYYFGYGITGIDDANGDGYDDILVGAPNASSSSGAAFLYNGSASGVSTTASGTIAGLYSRDYYGRNVRRAGDVNGDGYDDVMVGAWNYGTTGAMSFCYGGATGISTTSCTFTTGPTGSQIPLTMASLGDSDGDGYAEVVGADYATNTAVFFEGSASGIGTSSGTSVTPLYTLTGSTGTSFGSSLSAGDVDADAQIDLAVGAAGYSSSYGRVYVYTGETDADGDLVPVTTDCDDTDASVGAIASLYVDADGDGYGTGTATTMCPATGYVSTGGDCKDTDATVYPGATEVVADGKDQDCDSGDVCYADADSDGYTDGSSTVSSTDLDCKDTGEATATTPSGDCDDSDKAIKPSATEITGDEVDQNCDDKETCYKDADDDGYRPTTSSTVSSSDTDCADSGEALATEPSTDCDDADATINPAATDTTADGIDSDCSGTELCYVDADNDDYRLTTTVTSTDSDCSDSGEALSSVSTGDCKDTDATIYPGATEIIADDIDQDCSGTETCYADLDKDGYRAEADGTTESADIDCKDAGEAYSSATSGDCDDTDPAVFPGRPETCNSVDDDCDGVVDSPSPVDGSTWYIDYDDDGYTDSTDSTVACSEPDHYSAGSSIDDCDDRSASVYPGATEIVGDGVDQDCDGEDASGGGSGSGSEGGGAEGGGSEGGSSGGGSDTGDTGGGSEGGGSEGGGDSADDTATDSGSEGGGSEGGGDNGSIDDIFDTGENKGGGCMGGCSSAPGGNGSAGVLLMALALLRRRKV